MHTFNAVTITCLIVFIEKTIIVTGISGVHTIGTTGQLIPFIVGVQTSMVAARDLVMLNLKRVSMTGVTAVPFLNRVHSDFVPRDIPNGKGITSPSSSACSAL
jgi:hypothetical protein